MGKKFKTVAIPLVVIIIGLISYNYAMTGGGRDLEKEKSEFNMSAVDVFADFSANTEMATKNI